MDDPVQTNQWCCAVTSGQRGTSDAIEILPLVVAGAYRQHAVTRARSPRPEVDLVRRPPNRGVPHSQAASIVRLTATVPFTTRMPSRLRSRESFIRSAAVGTVGGSSPPPSPRFVHARIGGMALIASLRPPDRRSRLRGRPYGKKRQNDPER